MSFNISKQDFQQMLDFSDDRKVRFLYIITHHNADGSFHLGYSGQKTASSLSIANKYYGGSTNSFFKKETIKKNLSEYKFHVVGYCKNKEELCASEPALNKYLKDFYKDQWANKSLGVGKSTIEGYIYLIKNDELKMVKKEELDTYLSQGWLRGNNVKGLIGILKLDVQKFVKKEELDTYLREGWTQGSKAKGTIWITKNDELKMIKKNELETYLRDGWIKDGNNIKGFLGIHKEGIRKFVKKEDLDTYLSQGWIKGSVPGYISILKEDVQKFVKKEELDTYLREGWTQGVLRNVKDSIWINKEGIKKRVKKEELDTYLSQGWIKGCHIGI